MRTDVATLAVVFLAVHLFFLPPTLEDIDSINFALGVREFDVARHQPHPPGYPVFVALAKASTNAVSRLGVGDAAPRALSLLSTLAGALLVPLLFLLFRQVDPSVAWWATLVTVCSPLFWFTALRPLSDMTGLAAAAAAQFLLLSVFWQPHPQDPAQEDAPAAPLRRSPSAAARLCAGAAIAGLAAGVRVQTVVLTAPLLLAALLWPRTGLRMAHRAGAVMIAGLGVTIWWAPLVLITGGLGDYAAALGTQAGEDFSGVAMLWTTHHPRAVLDAGLHTFISPWGPMPLGAAVVLLAAAGAVRAAVRAPGMLMVLATAFGPYAVFHLLFQETVTLRYALPLIAPMALLALHAAHGAGRLGPAITGGVIALISLGLAAPAMHRYAKDGSPAFRMFAAQAEAVRASGEPPPALGMHAVLRRVEEWQQAPPGTRVLRARHGREWLALVEHWRAEPRATVAFLADPRRTDLALFDPHARRLTGSARWTFPESPFVAGVRPGNTDLYAMSPPGWMLGWGWALTAEIGGVTAAARLGPHVEPSVAWVRAGAVGGTLMLGGRNLDASRRIRLTVATDAEEIDSWVEGPGSFFRQLPVPEGQLAGEGYLALRVGAAAVDQGGIAPVALEQFDLQPAGVTMSGLVDGWHEPEYNPSTARSWRWMAERAHVWVRPVARDVTLTLTGESPLNYFDRPPIVRLTAAGTELARFTPADDFSEEVLIPQSALAASGGLVTLESDLWFTPAERSGAADRRRLALRLYRIAVR